MKKSTIVIICLLFLSFNIFSYTFSGSNNNRSGCADWQAADGDINTFWQLAENENEGYLIISGPEEKKEKLIITADIPEDSIIQLYVKGGKGLKSISSCVKEGPFNGEFEFNIKENTSQIIRENEIYVLKVVGEKAFETKIYEIECITNQENQDYEEWGKINLDDNYLYEMLILESFQAGLSWECILNKREYFRKAYDDFNINRICKYNDKGNG